MQTIALIVHLLLALGLIVVVLMQRSEGGGLGMGGGANSGGLFSARGAANALTRVTAVLGGLFMLSSLFLAILAGQDNTGRSIFDTPRGVETSTILENAPQNDSPTVPIAE